MLGSIYTEGLEERRAHAHSIDDVAIAPDSAHHARDLQQVFLLVRAADVSPIRLCHDGAILVRKVLTVLRRAEPSFLHELLHARTYVAFLTFCRAKHDLRNLRAGEGAWRRYRYEYEQCAVHAISVHTQRPQQIAPC
jgi:hypothetical protein